jgi:hypothetical protein
MGTMGRWAADIVFMWMFERGVLKMEIHNSRPRAIRA